MTPSAEPEVDGWLAAIEDLYGPTRAKQFLDEKEELREYLIVLRSHLSSRYKLDHPIKVGGSGVVFEAKRLDPPDTVVLKFNRPIDAPDGSLVAHEAALLPLFRHPNIVQVIDRETIAHGSHPLTYLTEWAIPGVQFDEFVQTKVEAAKKEVGSRSTRLQDDHTLAQQRIDETVKEILRVLDQWLSSVDYLHSEGFIYVDLKPSNLLVQAGPFATLIDFGSAEKLEPGSKEEIPVAFTDGFAHPVLVKSTRMRISSNRVRGSIERGKLEKAFDFYSLGRSVITLLGRISATFPHDATQVSSFRTLWLLATRLLDGQNDDAQPGSGLDGTISETFHGLTRGDYQILSYKGLSDAISDIHKESSGWDLESEIPELSPFSKEMIRVVPGTNTPLTPRLKAIIEHPVFARLKLVSQLGTLSLVYPTAEHSRFNHVLGTYTYAAQYIRSLYNDSYNPIFRNLVSASDIRAALLASLLHDLGQYPCAHDLEEVSRSIFSHTRLTNELLASPTTDSRGRTLKQLIEDKASGWGVSIEAIRAILGHKARASDLLEREPESDLKADLLSAIIDGPIDADKVDYILRDSVACGVPYGSQVDVDRLLRVLTVAPVYHEQGDRTAHRFAVGVYDKGKSAARSVSGARYLLYSSVYWHHASRIVMAMLQYAVAVSLPDSVFADPPGPSGQRQINELRSQLKDFAIDLYPPFNEANHSKPLSGLRAKPPTLVDSPLPRAAGTKPGTVAVTGPQPRGVCYPGLSWTDWTLLRWIRTWSPTAREAQALLDQLLTRSIYKRVATFHTDQEKWKLSSLRARSWPARVQLCRELRNLVSTRVEARLPALETTLDTGIDEIRGILKDELCILIDAPDPTTKIGFDRPLVLVPELESKSYYQRGWSVYRDSEWADVVTRSMADAAPVRVLCHPKLRKVVSYALYPVDESFSKLIGEALKD
jgi:HD superfamily phosphohydrolase